MKEVDQSDPHVKYIADNENYNKQLIVVDYRVTSVSGKTKLDDFRKDNFSVSDGTTELGKMDIDESSDIMSTIEEGESKTIGFGVGFKNKSNTATVKFHGHTWSGPITQ